MARPPAHLGLTPGRPMILGRANGDPVRQVVATGLTHGIRKGDTRYVTGDAVPGELAAASLIEIHQDSANLSLAVPGKVWQSNGTGTTGPESILDVLARIERRLDGIEQTLVIILGPSDDDENPRQDDTTLIPVTPDVAPIAPETVPEPPETPPATSDGVTGPPAVATAVQATVTPIEAKAARAGKAEMAAKARLGTS